MALRRTLQHCHKQDSLARNYVRCSQDCLVLNSNFFLSFYQKYVGAEPASFLLTQDCLEHPCYLDKLWLSRYNHRQLSIGYMNLERPAISLCKRYSQLLFHDIVGMGMQSSELFLC